MTRQPDWTLWRSFAAVVDAGSLSGAARRLGLTQPTMGRHVEELERLVGARLFERSAQGLSPTEAALRLYEPVARARNALAEASLVGESASTALEGTVRITASTVVSHYLLPPLLRDLREHFPLVDIELVPSDSVENLLLRESDIALRMFRPTQLDLVTRKLGVTPIVCCAHQTYLDAHGVPESIEALRQHSLVGFDRSDLMLVMARQLGLDLRRADFAIRTDSQTAAWELVRAGLGVGFAQRLLVDRTPGMVPLLADLPLPPLEIWLTSHKELQTSRRIRAVYDRLTETVGALLNPTAP